MASLGPFFYKKLINISTNIGMKPEDILNVMAVESGINPSAHNKNGNASGLVQFMPSTLKNLGFKGTHEEFRNLEAENQLDYVEKLIRSMMKINGGPFKSAAQYYVGNFVPAALKIPGIRDENPRTIICSKEPFIPHIPGVDIKHESMFYKANSGLDADKDGDITFGDIQVILKRAARSKNYQNAIADLHNYTNYQPDYRSLDKNEDIFSKYLAKYKGKDMDVYDQLAGKRPAPQQMLANTNNNLDSVLNNYLQMIAASEKVNKKLYKKYLPINHAVIKVEASDYVSSVEFAHILCAALDEELVSDSFIHTDGNHVEVECTIPGPPKDCFEAVTQLSQVLADTFKHATIKIGGVQVKTRIITNKKSSYQEISLNAAEIQHRKFLLKFI